jgi:hypothetical protein
MPAGCLDGAIRIQGHLLTLAQLFVTTATVDRKRWQPHTKSSKHLFDAGDDGMVASWIRRTGDT